MDLLVIGEHGQDAAQHRYSLLRMSLISIEQPQFMQCLTMLRVKGQHRLEMRLGLIKIALLAQQPPQITQ